MTEFKRSWPTERKLESSDPVRSSPSRRGRGGCPGRKREMFYLKLRRRRGSREAEKLRGVVRWQGN